MKHNFKWMFAAILICGLTVSSCKKDPAPEPEPEPVKQTVLASMVGTGVSVFDSVTYNYEYDAEYRLARIEAHLTNTNEPIQDYRFTYTDGNIKVEGTFAGDLTTYDCTLDSLGRITHMDETYVHSDTASSITHFDFTYDADGHLATSNRLSEPNGGGAFTKYIWEGEELRSTDTGDGMIVVDFETSDAPAQAMFSILGYHVEISELCAQGCFGKLPAHMPSKRTVTTAFPVPGMAPIVKVFDYTYTTNAEGRLATCEDSSDNGTTKYTFNWEER